MELDKKPTHISKKFWKTLRIVVYMMKKSTVRKNKLLLDIQTLFNRGKSALADSNYYSTLTCRSTDEYQSFVSPREYEFSCSTTPAHNTAKRKNRQPDEQIDVVKKLLEMLNNNNNNNLNIESSPYLPGFGRSPGQGVRQLRVTDSPFAPNDGAESGSCEVDKDCEEFINKFYKSLKKEKKIAAMGTPSPCHLWAS